MAEKSKPEKCPSCNERKKMRPEEEYKTLMNRLNRAIGQLNGVKRMLEENAYCADILIQANATTAAINSFSKQLLSFHLKSCVEEDLRSGKEDSVDELVNILGKMLR